MHSAFSIEQPVTDVFEIGCVGAEADRATVAGWLKHVLTTTGTKASTHKCDGRCAPPVLKFTDGINEQYGVGVPVGMRCSLLAATAAFQASASIINATSSNRVLCRGEIQSRNSGYC